MAAPTETAVDTPIAARRPADPRCPHLVFGDVLGAAMVARLLEHVAARETHFRPAVVRNRLRRRIRGVLVELARSGELGLPGGVLLISPSPEVVQRTPDELRRDVRSLLEALERRRSVDEAR